VLLHLGYWLLYLLLIMAIQLSNGIHHSFRNILFWLFRPPLLWVAILPYVVTFYIFYGLLFPRLLQRRQLKKLLLTGLSVILLVTALALLPVFFSPPIHRSYTIAELLGIFGFIAIPAMVHGIIALVMKGFITWYGDIHWKEQLVRSQLNPHFLFNTLNNIDVLIGKDPAQASAYLNKLSDILRFTLYEARTDKIPLEKELLFIDKYLDLQKIRTANPDHVRYTVEGQPGAWLIAPMLFIPFIENAFKYADNKTTAAIRISLRIEKKALNFICENNYIHRDDPSQRRTPGQSPAAGGLGNALIQKRLNLLYPGRYALEITDEKNIYKAKLVLNGRDD